MKNKNFSDVILKLDGNTCRAANKYTRKVVYEYETKEKNFPFNTTDQRCGWQSNKEHYTNNPLNGEKKLANQTLRKSMEGIFQQNSYYSNNNNSISKTFYQDDSNKYNSKNQNNDNQKFPRINRSNSVILNFHNGLENISKIRNEAREYYFNSNQIAKEKIFGDPLTKKENKKIILLHNRSKGAQITFIWEKDQTTQKTRNSFFNGWMTKDSNIFTPKMNTNLISDSRKMTKSVDLNSFKNNKTAGIKYKESHLYDEILYYNYQNHVYTFKLEI